MSIVLYQGTPGSGKSLSAAYQMIFKLKMKRNIICNFPISFSYFPPKNPECRKCPYCKTCENPEAKDIGKFTFVPNVKLTPDYLRQYAKENHVPFKESQTTVIIDECGAMFNTRDWGANDRMAWLYFFQIHRKLGFDFILISQSDKMIDKQIRCNIETAYMHRNVKNYKFFGLLLSLLFKGFFVRIEYWYNPSGKSLRCGSEVFFLNKKKANIYNTFQLFE